MAKIEMKEIRLAECIESPTNPRGGKNEPENQRALSELVASIKEKGVIVPVLARKVGDKYEVIAGNRRLRAARIAELKTIPAKIVEMSDVEAREAQIVENLQRQDISPLDEGTAYRLLIESSKPRYTLEDVAKKVGKSETYVRDRLALTNLIKSGREAFRDGEMGITAAMMIAKLDEAQQKDAIKQVVEYDVSIERLRDWIASRVYTDLGKKPWAKNAELAKILGDDGGKETLFGKNPTEDPTLYATQMSAYIELMMRKAAEKGEQLVKICTDYGTPQMKGVLAQDQYRILHSKEQVAAAKTVMKGIVAEGHRDIGRVFNITTDKEEVRQSSAYKKTPAEKAKAKKEREKEQKRRAANESALAKALGKVKAPLSQKHIDALFTFTIRDRGGAYQQTVVKALGLEVVKTKNKGWNGKVREERDHEATLKKYADTNNKKLQVVFALLMPGVPTSEYDDGKYFHEGLKKI